MLDILFAFISGCIFASWVHHLQGKQEKFIDTPQKSVFKEILGSKPVKPDNKKARYYQSPEYKREKALVERYKKGAVE